jgi:hypothetical protein
VWKAGWRGWKFIFRDGNFLNFHGAKRHRCDSILVSKNIYVSTTKVYKGFCLIRISQLYVSSELVVSRIREKRSLQISCFVPNLVCVVK